MKEVQYFKKKLFGAIRKLHIRSLVSISLIGSFQYSKKFEAVNDIDFIVLVKKLTPSLYKEINTKFQYLAWDLSTPKLSIIIEKRIGPLKPQPVKGKILVQLHLLIYDIYGWKHKDFPTSTLDWTNFSVSLFGKPLSSIRKIRRFNKNALLYDLNTNLVNIRTGTAYSKILVIRDNRLVVEKRALRLSQNERDEGILYNIITSIVNYLRYFDPTLRKDELLILRRAKKYLSRPYYHTVKHAFQLKKKIRSGYQLTKKQSSQLKSDGKSFVKYLLEKVHELP